MSYATSPLQLKPPTKAELRKSKMKKKMPRLLRWFLIYLALWATVLVAIGIYSVLREGTAFWLIGTAVWLALSALAAPTFLDID